MLLSKPDAICMARSSFYVDRQSYSSQPLRPNYEADQYVDCYRTLTCFRKDINAIKRNDYVKGYCLYALEIDPYYSFNVKRQGHCRLEMKFAKPLPESATLILYATFPEILNIDSSRSVFFERPLTLVYRRTTPRSRT